MSENPFLAPQFAPQTDSNTAGFSGSDIGRRRPNALTVILIVCLICGILGTLGSCMGGVGVAFNAAFPDAFQQNLDADSPEAVMQTKLNEINQAYVIPQLILVGINFIIAPMMFMGAIGGLNRKPWSLKVLSTSLIAAAVFVVIRLILGVVVQLKTMPILRQSFENADLNGQNEMVVNILGGMIWFSIVAGILFAIGQFLFYLWSYFYLNRTELRAYFETLP